MGRGVLGGKERCIGLGVQGKDEPQFVAVAFRRELYAVIEIKIVQALLNRQLHLRTCDVVVIPVHYRPNDFVSQRPSARKYSEVRHGKKRLPILADKESCDTAFDGCNPASRLAIARGDAIPDTPDILPALPPNAVEKCELQIVCLPMVPAIGNVHHMSWLKPFVTVYPGNRREFVLPPGQNVISYGLLVGATF